MQVTLKRTEGEIEEEPIENDKCLLRQKKHVLKEVALLDRYLTTRRHQLIQMFASADRLTKKCISVSDLTSILNKLKIPVSQATLELLLDILEIGDSGLINYSQLLDGVLVKKVENHFQRRSFVGSNPNPEYDGTSIDGASEVHVPLKRYNTPSSMDGKNGTLAGEIREEELKQFNSLIAFCKENEIVLDWKLAEKGTVALHCVV